MGLVDALLGLFCCGYGLMLIFAKDNAWSLVAWRNRNAGLVSKRTEQWDTMSTFWGMCVILIGLLVLFQAVHVTVRDRLRYQARQLQVNGRPATPQEQEEFDQAEKQGAFAGTNGQTVPESH